MKAMPIAVPARGAGWPPPPNEYEFIAVDFDGTLFQTRFPEIIAPNMHIINWCIDQQRRGAKIILHTCREAERLEAAVAESGKYGLRFDAVNENPFTEWELTPQSRKPHADIYLDDKAWRV